MVTDEPPGFLDDPAGRAGPGSRNSADATTYTSCWCSPNNSTVPVCPTSAAAVTSPGADLAASLPDQQFVLDHAGQPG